MKITVTGQVNRAYPSEVFNDIRRLKLQVQLTRWILPLSEDDLPSVELNGDADQIAELLVYWHQELELNTR